MEFENFLLFRLNKLLELAGQPVFLVGGFVREHLLGNFSNDLDFIIPENTVIIARELAKQTQGAFVMLDEERETGRVVWTVKRNGYELNFDIARLIGDSLENDLLLRDFAVNSIAVEVKPCIAGKLSDTSIPFEAGELYDPADGYNDIKNKIIRTCSEKNFIDDPLRILRAFRFASKLDFNIAAETRKSISKLAEYLAKPARERVLKELLEILAYNNAAMQIEDMENTSVNRVLFGPLYSPENNTSAYLKTFERIIEKSGEFQPYQELIRKYLFETTDTNTPKYILLKAVLIILGFNYKRSDFTRYIQETERFLKGCTFSTHDLNFILKILKGYSTPEELKRIDFSRKALFHYFRERKGNVTGMLLVSYIVSVSENSSTGIIFKLMDLYANDTVLVNPPQLIDGNYLMKTLNLKPGPKIGELLLAVQEAQAETKVATIEEILIFLKESLGTDKKTV